MEEYEVSRMQPGPKEHQGRNKEKLRLPVYCSQDNVKILLLVFLVISDYKSLISLYGQTEASCLQASL